MSDHIIDHNKTVTRVSVSTCHWSSLVTACPAGWVSANGKFPGCQACPLGTYQNRLSRKACKECPSNTTTNETGVVSKDQCHTVNTGSDEGEESRVEYNEELLNVSGFR